MSDRHPIARLSYKSGSDIFSVLSIWPGNMPGSYSISRDKGSDKYPAISLLEALKRWASGDGYLNVWTHTPREAPRKRRDDFEDEIPF